jgi:hypothetical protein
MTLDPRSLESDLDLLEAIERATLRLVVQAIYDFLEDATEIFALEQDRVADIGEDITREALDRLGTSSIPVRLSGSIDYKRARYIFHEDFSLRQALFVDSKAEKVSGRNAARIQTAQTSMRVRQVRAGQVLDEPGGLPTVVDRAGNLLLTTTVFVKYNYDAAANSQYDLSSISVLALSNGMLQERHNPTAADTFWIAGPNAPTRDEPFRVRISLPRLKGRAAWRVQSVQLKPTRYFSWDE